MTDTPQPARPTVALTVQVHAPGHPESDGGWVDIAQVGVHPTGGYRSPSTTVPLLNGTGDCRRPTLLPELPDWDGDGNLPTWPPFLLDLLPQWGRGYLPRSNPGATERAPDGVDDPALQLPYLLSGAASPIGNLRVEEAALFSPPTWSRSGWNEDGLHQMNSMASTIASLVASHAPAAFGLQGAWPKFLVVRSRMDGRWYPETAIHDGDAGDWAIVKWGADGSEVTEAILSSEAPYVALCHEFGLRTARRPRYRDGVLAIPRFDRSIGADGRHVRHAQMSIAAATGRIGFGVYGTHEAYLATIKRRCADPRAEVVEYVLRDVFNMATGNTDNHGRNTALRIDSEGRVALTPVYDVCPQGLALPGERRATEWECEREGTQPPDWSAICEVAAEGVMATQELRDILAAHAPFLHGLQFQARIMGLHSMVVEQSMAGAASLGNALARLA